MKTLIILLTAIFYPFLAQAQEKSLAGTWNITEVAIITADGTQKIMEEEIKSGDAISTYVIGDDGTFKLTSNMTGSGTMDNYEGTWKESGDNLIFTLSVNGQSVDVEWGSELNDDTLVLTRKSPDGSTTVTNRFKKE